FTIQNVLEYTRLNSGYSQLMYSLLKEWEKAKIVEFEINKFRELLGIPKGYRISEIDKFVLAPIFRELPQYFHDLKLEKIKTGKKITSLKFTWKRKVEKIVLQKDEVIDIIEISEKLNYTIEKAKKNRFINPLLTVDNIEILVGKFNEKELIKGLKWSYKEIQQEIKSLNYLTKSIKTGIEQTEKKIVVKTVPRVIEPKENNLDLKKDQNSNIPEIKKIEITKAQYEGFYKEYLNENQTEHNQFSRKGFDMANRNKYEIVEKVNNLEKNKDEPTITKEKNELIYQNFLSLNDCVDSETTRNIFDLLYKEKYKRIDQSATISIDNLNKSKTIISVSDIPEEKLLGKNKKKLIGGALVSRLEKIAKDEKIKIQYKERIIGE
ncbi:MAG: replication initiation protein, partial [Fusobacteriaceae bacterium]